MSNDLKNSNDRNEPTPLDASSSSPSAAQPAAATSSGLDRRILLGVAGLAGVAALSRVSRAGSLTPPPGPITATGSSVAELQGQLGSAEAKISNKVARSAAGFAEPRLPITSCPSSPDAQFVISEPGAYYLPSNLVQEAGRVCVDVQCDDVDIDGQGFAFVGSPSPVALPCVRAVGRRNLEIYDCTFVSCPGECVSCSSCDCVFVSDCHFHACGSFSPSSAVVSVRDGSEIDDCTFKDCVGCCVSCRDHSAVIGIACTGGPCRAVRAGSNCCVEDCSAQNLLVLPGIADACYDLSVSCTISECSAFACDGLVFSLGAGCSMDECEVHGGTGPAAVAGERSNLCGMTNHFRTSPASPVVQCADGTCVSECEFRTCTCPAALSVGSSCVVECCEFTNCVGGAVVCADACSVEDCTIMNCDGVAVHAGSRCSIEDNHALQCLGIECGAECCVCDNEVSLRPPSGTSGGSSGGAISVLGERCCITGNFVSSGGIIIFFGGDRALIEDNHVVGAGGPAGTGGGSISIAQGVVGCAVRSNHVRRASMTNAFVIPGGNSFGPVANTITGGDLSTIAGASHPHANFVY